jgi:predicted ester cyclase
MKVSRFTLALALASATFATSAQAADALVAPQQLVVDHGLTAAQAEAEIQAARRYDTFWNNGDEALARTALSPAFMDRTLPPGRPQGLEGPLVASKVFRAAVPDLQCDVVLMLVAGDHVTSHLRFHGHFTGTFQGVAGSGQAIDFIATDIYRVQDGRIAENWHLEDNLTLLTQMGLVHNH